MSNDLIGEVSREWVENLVKDRIPESHTLEYKQEMPENREGRGDILKDVCAFANAGGGTIIFGVKERKESGKNTGEPNEICGAGVTDVDEAIRGMTHSIHELIEPRISGVRFEPFDIGNKRHVVVLEVPQSWCGPHRVTRGNHFYMRDARSNHEMTMDEIRLEFLQSSNLRTRMCEYVRSRTVDQLPAVQLASETRIWLHVIPFRSLAGGVSIQPSDASRHVECFQAQYGGNPTFALDGFMVEDSLEPNRRYCLVGRNGIVEAVDCMHPFVESGTERKVMAIGLAQWVLTSMKGVLTGLCRLRVPTPFGVFVTLRGVKRFTVVTGHEFRRDSRKLGGDTAHLPEAIIESYAYDKDFERRMIPTFDALWNAAGDERCWLYGSDGTISQDTRGRSSLPSLK